MVSVYRCPSCGFLTRKKPYGCTDSEHSLWYDAYKAHMRRYFRNYRCPHCEITMHSKPLPSCLSIQHINTYASIMMAVERRHGRSSSLGMRCKACGKWGYTKPRTCTDPQHDKRYEYYKAYMRRYTKKYFRCEGCGKTIFSKPKASCLNMKHIRYHARHLEATEADPGSRPQERDPLGQASYTSSSASMLRTQVPFVTYLPPRRTRPGQPVV